MMIATYILSELHDWFSHFRLMFFCLDRGKHLDSIQKLRAKEGLWGTTEGQELPLCLCRVTPEAGPCSIPVGQGGAAPMSGAVLPSQGQSWRIFIPGDEGLGVCRGGWCRAPMLPECSPLLSPLLGDPWLLPKGLAPTDLCSRGRITSSFLAAT